MCVTPASHPVNTDTHTRNEQEREREREREWITEALSMIIGRSLATTPPPSLLSLSMSDTIDLLPLSGNATVLPLVVMVVVVENGREAAKNSEKKHPSIDRINSVHTEREKPMKKTDKNKSGWNWTTS